MFKQWKSMMAGALVAGLAASTGQGALVITEVMSNSDHPGGAGNGDWWELTNTGPSDVDLTGYYWDDDGPTGDDGALFPSITINAGQSIVIVDENSSNIADWIAAWGGGITAYSEEDFGGPDSFSGLSADGDQIELWDSDPNDGPANLIASVTFGDSDGGAKSFEWFTTGVADGFSVDGQFGAYVAPGDGDGGTGIDVGSPGFAIPEPASIALLLAGGSLMLGRRRHA